MTAFDGARNAECEMFLHRPRRPRRLARARARRAAIWFGECVVYAVGMVVLAAVVVAAGLALQ